MAIMILALVLLWHIVLSIITLIAYRQDKRAAQSGQPRWPERSLHRLEWLGGWPGALVASRWFRHKTRKSRYRLNRSLIILIHVLIWLAILWTVFLQPPSGTN